MEDPFTGSSYAHRIHPEDQKVLETKTTPRNWKYAEFREILIDLETLRRVEVTK